MCVSFTHKCQKLSNAKPFVFNSERQVPPFLLRRPSHPSQLISQGQASSSSLGPGMEKSSSSSRFQDRSTSSGFQSASKTTSTLPSGGTGSSGVGTGLGSGGSGEIMLRPSMLPQSPGRDESNLHHMIDMFSGQYIPHQVMMIPQVPARTLPPRTYENWPRRESTPPIYAMARSPSFDIDEQMTRGGVTVTVPVSEASPGQRTILDMSVDDPYEFDPVIPDTSPEIAYPQPSSSGTSASTSRFKRTRDRERDMEARVAAMKEEFFEYRRRQKKRMESAC